MRRRNEFWGWGVVVFFGGVLATMIVSSTQPKAVNYIAMRQEPELEHQARQIASKDGGMLQDMVYIDSAIVSYKNWSEARGIYSAKFETDFPVYVYRAYGRVKSTTIYEAGSVQPYYMQTIEVSLDARTGLYLGLVRLPPDLTLNSLDAIAHNFEGTPESIPANPLATVVFLQTAQGSSPTTESYPYPPTLTPPFFELTSEAEYLETISALETVQAVNTKYAP